MPLDDREQRILAEIERQFYEEDPDLAHAVRNIAQRGLHRWGRIWSIVGMIVGIVLLLATFRFNAFLALAGFVVIVLSATGIVQSSRTTDRSSGGDDDMPEISSNWLGKIRNLRRRHPSD